MSKCLSDGLNHTVSNTAMSCKQFCPVVALDECSRGDPEERQDVGGQESLSEGAVCCCHHPGLLQVLQGPTELL